MVHFPYGSRTKSSESGFNSDWDSHITGPFMLCEQFLWHTTQLLIAGLWSSEMCIGMHTCAKNISVQKSKMIKCHNGWSYSYWHRNIVCLVKASLYNGSLANHKNPPFLSTRMFISNVTMTVFHINRSISMFTLIGRMDYNLRKGCQAGYLIHFPREIYILK